MRFLTANSRIEQTDKYGYWKTIDNELYEDKDIYLVPRRFWSDGYSFPSFLLNILGSRQALDIRPAHQHDIGCRFHEVIRVKLSYQELIDKGYLKSHPTKNIMICENIPKEYLEITKIKKYQINNLLYRAMKAVNISTFTCCLIRFGTIFNFNWYFKTGKRSLNTYNIYEEDIGLVNGL